MFRCVTTGALHTCGTGCQHAIVRNHTLVCNLTTAVIDACLVEEPITLALGAGAMGNAADKRASVARSKARVLAAVRAGKRPGPVHSTPGNPRTGPCALGAPGTVTTLVRVPRANRMAGVGPPTLAAGPVARAPRAQARQPDAGQAAPAAPDPVVVAQVLEVLTTVTTPEFLRAHLLLRVAGIVEVTCRHVREVCTALGALPDLASLGVLLQATLMGVLGQHGLGAVPPPVPVLAHFAEFVAHNFRQYKAMLDHVVRQNRSASGLDAGEGVTPKLLGSARGSSKLKPLSVVDFTLACIQVLKQGFDNAANVAVPPCRDLEFVAGTYPSQLFEGGTAKCVAACRAVLSFFQQWPMAASRWVPPGPQVHPPALPSPPK